MNKSISILKSITLTTILLVYVFFVLLKYDTIQFYTADSIKISKVLVDWNDDRFCQDKEFTAEITDAKSFEVYIAAPRISEKTKATFLYNKVYPKIKLSVVTPPPEIG